LHSEAIFYPTIKNEEQENERIRRQTKECTAHGNGYLEALVKHTGSLILWSLGEQEVPVGVSGIEEI